MGLRVVVLGAALGTACTFAPGSAAQDGGARTADATDGKMADGTPDAAMCFSVGTLAAFCLQAPPSGDVSITSATLDTDNGVVTPAEPAVACAPLASGPPLCVIAASTIEIPSGQTLGAYDLDFDGKPLVLLATTSITIAGTLDGASHQGGATQGPGSDPSGGGLCNGGTNSSNGGGGQGGSFGSLGAAGGANGNAGATSAGSAGAVVAPTTLRGGCQGGDGNGGTTNRHGRGGGALAVIAPTITLTASAMIDASGGPGLGANTGQNGGNGGGSGGLIVLGATMLDIAAGARIFANGGPGGGGSNTTTPGGDGTDPGFNDGGSAGGRGGNGGDGGVGGFAASRATPGGPSTGGNNDGGGGGGGGRGIIHVLSPVGYPTSVFSPQPS